jgi:hypothetical protein
MAQFNRVAPHQNFLHQQSQNLLSHGDIQRLGSHPQFAAESRQALCQL